MALLLICFMTMEAKRSYILLAPGVEEIEAMATIDALRRADIQFHCILNLRAAL